MTIQDLLMPDHDIVDSLLHLEFNLREKEKIAAEKDQFLEKWSRKEAVTLFDSKPFLNYMASIAIHGNVPPNYNRHLQIYQELKQYYADTHQKGGFEEIEVLARQSAFLSILKDPVTFKRLNTLAAADDSGPVKLYKQLCHTVIKDIQHKKNEHPSIHGHPRDLFNSQDKKILEALSNRRHYPLNLNLAEEIFTEAGHMLDLFNNTIYATNHDLQMHEGLFRNLENRGIERLNSKPISDLTQAEIDLILEAKEALMKIDLGPGRSVELSLLAEDASVNPIFRQGIKNLMALDDRRGEAIDLAMFQRFKQQHDQATAHPRVAIEGGGPTGLLMAITQFLAGAKVTIFEKRSMFYDRTQIVRLDTKWMTMLKFYLGEDYYKLFKDEGHRGVIRPDGFGEIATVFLEEALHERLTKLMSIMPTEKNGDPSIERLAAYEMREIKSSEEGKFQAIAVYSEQYSPEEIVANASEHPASPDRLKPGKSIVRDIDMLICAGGKSSPLKEKFLPSSMAVTEQQNYAVCSWLSRAVVGRTNQKVRAFPGQDSEQFNMFQDFRGMVNLDPTFRANFQARLVEEFHPSSLMNSGLSDKASEIVRRFIANDLDFEKFIEEGPKQPYVQTRTFENLGLVYIGMEIPQEVRTAFVNMEEFLNQFIEASLIADRKGLQMERDMIIKHFQQVWFQTVAERYGLDTSHGMTMDNMDRKFATMFPVEQNRLHKDHFFSQINKGANSLFIAAAGDANNSPHFMRYSGLTGAREDIIGLQKWTRGIASQLNPEEQEALKKELENNWERTSEFVISRGLAFLNPTPEKDIERLRKDKMIKLLDKQVEETSHSKSLYLVEKESDDYYRLHFSGKIKLMSPQGDGSLEMDGRRYESFEQIKLENGLS